MSSIPRTTVEAIALALVEMAETNPTIPNEAFDLILVQHGLLSDLGDPTDRTTVEWNHRIATRNRVRGKVNALLATMSTPMKLIMEEGASGKDHTKLGTMRLHGASEMMGTVIDNRSRKTTGYVSTTAKMANGFIKKHHGEMDAVTMVHLQFAGQVSDILAKMSGELNGAVRSAIDNLTSIQSMGAAALPHPDDGAEAA